MVKVEDDYLINELKRGRYINVGLLCHNAYWYDITKLHKYYENFNVAFTADSIVHINDIVLKEFENSDLIIFDSSNYYDERQITELKTIAIDISNKKSKRVTIGYSSLIPVEQKTKKNQLIQIKIVSFKDGQEITEEVTIEDFITTHELIDLTLNIADNYENNKQSLLIKKL